MKKTVIVLMALAMTATMADAKRSSVRIYKPSPPPAYVPGTAPLVAVPPVAVVFDLVRRTSCDPRIAVSTGKGDPGFDLNGPRTGNFLIPATYRKECQAQPKHY